MASAAFFFFLENLVANAQFLNYIPKKKLFKGFFKNEKKSYIFEVITRVYLSSPNKGTLKKKLL